MMFLNRIVAGTLLARRLVNFKKPDAVVAIPKGGVVVAEPIARLFTCPIAVRCVSKICWSEDQRVGIGAIEQSGLVVRNTDFMTFHDVKETSFDHASQSALDKLNDLTTALAPWSEIVVGSSALVVDDGLATGYSALAAVNFLQSIGYERIVVAAPVASRYAIEVLETSCTKVVVVHKAEQTIFIADDYYNDFKEPSHDEIKAILTAMEMSCVTSVTRE